MASRTALLLVAAAMAAVALLLPATESSKMYTVGDGSGWDVAVDYEAWARDKNFKIGDTLVFRYNAGQDVVVVDAQNYADCTAPENAPVFTSGHDYVSLGGPGPLYFICDAEGECASGMKLAIYVS